MPHIYNYTVQHAYLAASYLIKVHTPLCHWAKYNGEISRENKIVLMRDLSRQITMCKQLYTIIMLI